MKKLFFSVLTIFFLLVPGAFSQEKVPASGRIFATMFFDYYYMLSGEDSFAGTSTYALNQANDNAFSFRRVYLGYDHNFSERFSARILLELSDFSTLPNGTRGFFLKDASFSWKNIYPLADLIIGQTQTPAFSVQGSEYFWQYRSVERTIADLRGIRSSSDAGIRIRGRFNKAETFGYNLMVGNGTGTRPETDKYKVIYFNIWTRQLDNRLYFELYQDFNRAPDDRHLAVTKGFAAWQTPHYTIGLELFRQLRSGFGFENQDISFFGSSIFAHASIITDQLRGFIRYDSYDPDVKFSPAHYHPEAVRPFNEHFFTVGFDYSPWPNINIMPNIWINSYKAKSQDYPAPDTELVARITFNVALR